VQQKLIQKYLEGLATPIECEEIELWYASIQIPYTAQQDESNIRTRIHHKITQNTSLYNQHSSKSVYKFWLSIAAAILLMAIPLFLLKNSIFNKADDQLAYNIAPGGARAILTLSGGKRINLDSTSMGRITNKYGFDMTAKDGRLVYATSTANKYSNRYHTLSTLKGGNYELILPDGSHIWLNASSSIKFPETFEDGPRIVEITGEAYFEVAPKWSAQRNSPVPFTVKSGQEKIEVLGTHFNVRHYSAVQNNRVTLIEGKVRISKNGQTVLLMPGEAVETDKKNAELEKITGVNTEAAMAWKNGIFYFERATVPEILNEVAQWYNIDVNYIGLPPKQRFTGKVLKSKNLSSIIEILRQGDIHFTIDKRKLTVYNDD